MTGLLIKELIIRGDVAKCLIVAPGSLVEQWQDELDQKFNLAFDIMTNDAIQAFTHWQLVSRTQSLHLPARQTQP